MQRRFDTPVGRASPGRQLGSVASRFRHPWQPLCGHDRIRAEPRRTLASVHGITGSGELAPASTNEAPGDSALQGQVRGDRIAALEAALFVAKVPLHTRKLAQYANLADGTEARTLMLRLNQAYREAGRAFHVIEVAGGWQLRTRPQFANWLRRLPHVPKQIRLSAPAMETLAVIAYRQPVIRADVELIRGVACGEIIRQLMERNLVRVSGRSEELGRPFLYSTTKSFLEVFGLRSINELPRRDWLDNAEQLSVAVDECNNSDEGEEQVSTSAAANIATFSDAVHGELPITDVQPDDVTNAGSIRSDVNEDEWEDEEDDWDDEDGDDDVLGEDEEWVEVDDDDDEDEDDDEELGDDEEWVEVDDDEDEELGDDEEWVEVDDDDDLDDLEEWEEVDEDDDEDDDYEYEYEEVEVDDESDLDDDDLDDDDLDDAEWEEVDEDDADEDEDDFDDDEDEEWEEVDDDEFD